MHCLSHALALLYHQFELAYPEKHTKASADYVIPALICLLMQAKLTDPFATYRLLQNFGNISHSQDLEENFRTNFLHCHTFILELQPENLKLSEEEVRRYINKDESFFDRRSEEYKKNSLDKRQSSNPSDGSAQ